MPSPTILKISGPPASIPSYPAWVAPDEVDDEDRQRRRVERRVEPSSAEGAGAVRQVQVVDNAPDRGDCGTHRTEEG